MWLIMRGALSANIKKIHQSYYLPTMTGLATAIYENEVDRADGGHHSQITGATCSTSWMASKSWKARIRSL